MAVPLNQIEATASNLRKIGYVIFDSVAQPAAAHAARTELCPTEALFVRDAPWTIGGEIEGVVEDLLLDVGTHAIGVRIHRSTAFLVEGGHSADLECTADLVECVAVIANKLAGIGDVPALFGQLQQG